MNILLKSVLMGITLGLCTLLISQSAFADSHDTEPTLTASEEGLSDPSDTAGDADNNDVAAVLTTSDEVDQLMDTNIEIQKISKGNVAPQNVGVFGTVDSMDIESGHITLTGPDGESKTIQIS